MKQSSLSLFTNLPEDERKDFSLFNFSCLPILRDASHHWELAEGKLTQRGRLDDGVVRLEGLLGAVVLAQVYFIPEVTAMTYVTLSKG